MQHRSISQRLKKAKSMQTKKQIMLDWADNWRREQLNLITRLQNAIDSKCEFELCSIARDLEGVTKKRFSGLTNSINLLTAKMAVVTQDN